MKALSQYAPSDCFNLRRNFSPSMFIACACTGLVAILLDVNPYLGRGWAVPLAWGFWWLGAVQFLVFASLLLARQVDLWGGEGGLCAVRCLA